jgi:ABC-type sugar transport system ATPase subunit
MRIELSKLHSGLQTTMIYVTHDQVEAMTLAEKIVVLNDGKVEQIGSPRDLYSRPANLFVAGFIGSPRMNFLKVKVVDGRYGAVTVASDDFLGSSLEIPVTSSSKVAPGAEATLGIRPEHLAVVAQANGKGVLTIEVVEMLGESTYVHGITPADNRLTIGLRGFNDLRHADSVGFDFELENAHLFDAAGNAM